jgi:hypothetical protein
MPHTLQLVAPRRQGTVGNVAHHRHSSHRTPDNVESSFARKRAESLEENHARIRLVDNCKRGKLGSTYAHITRDRVCRVKFEVGKSCRDAQPRGAKPAVK